MIKKIAPCIIAILFLTSLCTGASTEIYASSVKNTYSINEIPKNLISILTSESDTFKTEEELCQNLIKDNSEFSVLVSNPDGSITSYTFGIPIRYCDRRGAYQFIDTSFIPISGFKKITSKYDYINKANSFTVEFSEDAKYGMNFDGAFTMAVEEALEKNAIKAVVDVDENYDGRITYPKSFGEDIDVEYINVNSGVKENIIIRKNSGKNTFSFRWSSDYYKPILSEDKRVINIVAANDPNNIEYKMQELFAYDSCSNETGVELEKSDSQHYSEECFYDISEVAKNTYIITINVSKTFLDSEETVYPVIIDPSVTATKTSANVQDTFVSAGTPNTNYGSDSYLRIGYYPYHISSAHKMFAFIKFNTLPSINLENNLISYAQLKMFLINGTTTAPQTSLAIVNGAWSEYSLTWNNKPNGTSPYTRANSSNNCSYFLYDATEIVRYWYNVNNIGANIAYTNETSYDYNLFYSSDNSATAKAPLLTITYKSKTVYTNPTQTGANSSYNRNTAGNYAYQHAYDNSPDYDTSGGVQEDVYLRVGSAINAANDNNCTNFVSSCLHEGGMIYLGTNLINHANINNWKYGFINILNVLHYLSSHSWGSAYYFSAHWGVNLDTGEGLNRAYKMIIYDSAEDALSDWYYLCSTVAKGDVIQTAPENGTPNHSMIIYSKGSNTIQYAQHTGPEGQERYSLKTRLEYYKQYYPTFRWIFYVMK